jgi:hypothetical protein
MLNAAWVELASQTVLLGLDAQRVTALRLMRLAAGGALAKSEASRIITEKIEALGEAQTVAAISTMGGRTSRQVAKKQQRKGIRPTGEPERSTMIASTVLAFEPSTETEKIIDVETLRQSAHRIELSRARMSNVALGLPAVLWWVVAFCALMNIVLIWIQDMEIHVHLILGAVLASILGAVIFLIAELDNPFRGQVSIGPESIARVYEGVMQQDDPAINTLSADAP